MTGRRAGATIGACRESPRRVHSFAESPLQLDLPDSSIAGLAQLIQVSVAPVFLISGIGSFLGVLSNRLARIIDRTRRLEADPAIGWAGELPALRSRSRLVNRAIGLSTISAVLVASVIALLFLGALLPVNLTSVVAAGFVLAMLALIAALLSFLAEVRLATRFLHGSVDSDPAEAA